MSMTTTGIEVATVVASIISAYGTGVEILRRLAGRRPKRKGREPTRSEEDEWLRESLERRPVDIRNTYNRNVARLGHRFEIGDANAHSSLAHTLLLLNTGLIRLINHAMSKNVALKDVSKRSLLSLSEAAAADTLHALSQLSLRLEQRPQLSAIVEQLNNVQTERRQIEAPPKHKSKQKKMPVPGPLLVRGGWVRSKSGSSVVTTTTSVGKIEKVTPSKHQRSRSEPTPKQNLRLPRSTMGPDLQQYLPMQPMPEKFVDQRVQEKEVIPQTRPQRQPSMLLVPADFFDAHVPNREEPPPLPPKIPLHTRPNIAPRQRPLSSATFLTASTKIGEIPIEMDSKAYGANTRDKNAPKDTLSALPASLIGAAQESKLRNRGLKFWKRDNRKEIAMAS